MSLDQTLFLELILDESLCRSLGDSTSDEGFDRSCHVLFRTLSDSIEPLTIGPLVIRCDSLGDEFEHLRFVAVEKVQETIEIRNDDFLRGNGMRLHDLAVVRLLVLREDIVL